jgi:VWFA-related protein
VLKPLTTDLQEVQSAIQGLKFVPPPPVLLGPGAAKSPQSANDPTPPGSTAIWDALSFTCENIFTAPAPPTRRIIILITDGDDTSSQQKKDAAINRAVKDDVTVYAIGLGDKYYTEVNESLLRKLAQRTGGRAFFPKKAEDLQSILAEIEQELRSQYVVTYSPVSKKGNDSLRKLRIEVVNPEKKRGQLTLVYRPGYYPGGK